VDRHPLSKRDRKVEKNADALELSALLQYVFIAYLDSQEKSPPTPSAIVPVYSFG
jgi:hypothetical protein